MCNLSSHVLQFPPKGVTFIEMGLYFPFQIFQIFHSKYSKFTFYKDTQFLLDFLLDLCSVEPIGTWIMCDNHRLPNMTQF